VAFVGVFCLEDGSEGELYAVQEKERREGKRIEEPGGHGIREPVLNKG
jgi:hypothetical protein